MVSAKFVMRRTLRRAQMIQYFTRLGQCLVGIDVKSLPIALQALGRIRA
jgi:hypothetical protein